MTTLFLIFLFLASVSSGFLCINWWVERRKFSARLKDYAKWQRELPNRRGMEEALRQRMEEQQ